MENAYGCARRGSRTIDVTLSRKAPLIAQYHGLVPGLPIDTSAHLSKRQKGGAAAPQYRGCCLTG